MRKNLLYLHQNTTETSRALAFTENTIFEVEIEVKNRKKVEKIVFFDFRVHLGHWCEFVGPDIY